MTLETSNEKPNWRLLKRYKRLLEQIETTHTYYDYSKSVYTSIDNPIIITCPVHGDFEQTPYSHFTLNRDCRKCSHDKSAAKRRNTLEDFIERANTAHKNKYDYSKTEYISNGVKVTIICPIHGEFEQRAADHLRGCGCRKCGSMTAGKSLTAQQFIDKANAVHNNKYDYYKTKYTRMKFKVMITCPYHGDFIQNPDDHLAGNGCQVCGENRKRAKYFKEPTILYYVYFPAFDVYKIGITLQSRGVKKRFANETCVEYKIIQETLYQTGKEAYLEEQRILKENSKSLYKGPKFFLKGGESECFENDVLGLNKDEDIVEPVM